MPTTAEYLYALVKDRIISPADEANYKFYCVRCLRFILYEELDLEDPETDPLWCFCDECKPYARSLIDE
jgi:hypothetical protein